MQSNPKLRLAVATAVSLIATGLQGNALALGLSDILVKSHLGQPFKAKVQVLGASEIKDASCFKMVNNEGEIGNHLNNALLKLGNIVDDQATLTILTDQAINEPILNFSIVAECEGSIQHDYVVLLEPTFDKAIVEADEEQLESLAVPAPVKKSKKTTTSQGSRYSQTTIFDAAPRSAKTFASVKKFSNQEAIRPSAGMPPQFDNKLDKPSVASTQPRLSISSGSGVQTLANLRIDRNLNTPPDANASAVSSNVEIDDEMTAMNYRLVDLEKQLHRLRQENVSLKSENKLKTEQLEQVSSVRAKLVSILPFLGGGLLLVAAYFGFGMWRRRQAKLAKENMQAIWSETNQDIEKDKPNLEVVAATEESIFDDVAVQTPVVESVKITEQAPMDKAAAMKMSFEATKHNDEPIILDEEGIGMSVLDHADVFLSHGRTSLAIQLLQGHLQEHPKQSVTIWLFLLDLLAKENMQEDFEKTALECKEHFNVRINGFAKVNFNNHNSIQTYPHLCEGLQQVWNTPGCIVYLDDLIYNTRLEPRAGFEKSLIEELLLLRSIAQQNDDSGGIIVLNDRQDVLKDQKNPLFAAKKAEKFEAPQAEQITEVAKEEEKKKEYLVKLGLIE